MTQTIIDKLERADGILKKWKDMNNVE